MEIACLHRMVQREEKKKKKEVESQESKDILIKRVLSYQFIVKNDGFFF